MDTPEAAVRASVSALIDALAAADDSGDAAHLVRVRAARRARAVVAEVCEAALDEAILAARLARPEGATWKQLGDELGVTGQAVSKRAGVRSLSRARRLLSDQERAQRRRQRYLDTYGALPPQWDDDLDEPALAPESTPEPPPARRPSAVPEASESPAGQLSGAAFWRAQRPR
ncbi:hypothetical protein [Amycolatopsis echigonensis]|uniref:Uncharacterized protein n=1 Tax=Amycolatopsis echigonensis TaxID=2576905 RepID=A0A8E1W837_9PSEU|nr:hypothetical protein [Amycolatopsis echigonensis]MBB2505249.1 hypothetical protein [Amycolatopsis echigonensis]